jgi:hypothetical protein
MSQVQKRPEDMTDEELLESIASLDSDTYPVAEIAENALEKGHPS